jgi:hypothetical protein
MERPLYDDDDIDDDIDDDDDDSGGCMSAVDREAVRMGAAKALPPDAYGRAVIFFKRNGGVPKELVDQQPVLVRTHEVATPRI